MDEVEYREIPSFSGYRAGSDGSIWSRMRSAGGLAWKPLRPRRSRGYRWFSLRRSGRYVKRRAGRFVLEAFVGPMPTGQMVRHRNDIKHDDRLDNLCYGTCAENCADAMANGRTPRGERHANAKICEAMVREIRRLKVSGLTYDQISAQTGVKRSTAAHIVTRRLWRHVA